MAVSRLLALRSRTSFPVATDSDLIERVDRCVKLLLRQMKINGGVFQMGMTQQKLNRAEIRASFEQVCGVRVSQGVLVLLMICIPRKSAIAITRAME
jgi:hypothetical protein